MVPSSPFGPCIAIKITSILLFLIIEAWSDRFKFWILDFGFWSFTLAGESNKNCFLLPICQLIPSFAITIGKTLYFFGFKFLTTSLPEESEISCSADFPPIITAIFSFLMTQSFPKKRQASRNDRSLLFLYKSAVSISNRRLYLLRKDPEDSMQIAQF